MFIGHFGLSFAAKKAAPQVSLGTLFFATQFVDILWPLLLVLKLEKVVIVPGFTETNSFEFLSYPYTHSLLGGAIWGALIAFIYWVIRKDKQGAVVVGLCVLSHWFLDLIVHVPDLPLTPFDHTKVGLGLWKHLAATLILETVLYFVGVYIYVRYTKAKNKIGIWGLAALVLLLFVFYLGNTFGPAPTDIGMTMFISATLLMAILVAFAHWVDRNRI